MNRHYTGKKYFEERHVRMNRWNFLDSGVNTGIANMSVDEQLLARAQAEKTLPVLRFYGWAPPAVSLGRFQKAETAVNVGACAQRGIDIVQRVTGGRAVFHCHELTYSIVARIDDPLFPADVLGAYKIIATGLLAGLANLGISAEMVSRPHKHAPSAHTGTKDPACFSSPSRYELVVEDRKIIGSAQRRLSRAFLQHGSILLDYDAGLEAELIPGERAGDAVTSIRRERGQDVRLADVKQAFLNGFTQALRIEFTAITSSVQALRNAE
jgi:lipoate-protein ligase A